MRMRTLWFPSLSAGEWGRKLTETIMPSVVASLRAVLLLPSGKILSSSLRESRRPGQRARLHVLTALSSLMVTINSLSAASSIQLQAPLQELEVPVAAAAQKQSLQSTRKVPVVRTSKQEEAQNKAVAMREEIASNAKLHQALAEEEEEEEEEEAAEAGQVANVADGFRLKLRQGRTLMPS